MGTINITQTVNVKEDGLAKVAVALIGLAAVIATVAAAIAIVPVLLMFAMWGAIGATVLVSPIAFMRVRESIRDKKNEAQREQEWALHVDTIRRIRSGELPSSVLNVESFRVDSDGIINKKLSR